jgi:hypothetical protein
MDALREKFDQAFSRCCLRRDTETARVASARQYSEVASIKAWIDLRPTVASNTTALPTEVRDRFAHNRSVGLLKIAQEIKDMISRYLPVHSRLALGLTSRELFLNMTFVLDGDSLQPVCQTAYLIRYYMWTSRAESPKQLFCASCLYLHRAPAFPPDQVALPWWRRSCLLLKVCGHRTLNLDELMAWVSDSPAWSWRNRTIADSTLEFRADQIDGNRPGLCCKRNQASHNFSRAHGCELRRFRGDRKEFSVSTVFYSEDSIFDIAPGWEWIIVQETRRKLRKVMLCHPRRTTAESVCLMLTGEWTCQSTYPLAINGFRRLATEQTAGSQTAIWRHTCLQTGSNQTRRVVELRATLTTQDFARREHEGLTTLSVEIVEGIAIDIPELLESTEEWTKLVSLVETGDMHGAVAGELEA